MDNTGSESIVLLVNCTKVLSSGCDIRLQYGFKVKAFYVQIDAKKGLLVDCVAVPPDVEDENYTFPARCFFKLRYVLNKNSRSSCITAFSICG